MKKTGMRGLIPHQFPEVTFSSFNLILLLLLLLHVSTYSSAFQPKLAEERGRHLHFHEGNQQSQADFSGSSILSWGGEGAGGRRGVNRNTAESTRGGGCGLIENWRGEWFQSGLDPYHTNLTRIDNNSISSKGTCLEKSGDKYLFLNKFEQPNCFRCLVINQIHYNVLQYKESSFCEDKISSLHDLCNEISGDAVLYFLFRANAVPEECPFRAPLTFTYNKGSGECISPVSQVDSCTDTSHLLFRYQACPNVHNTESKVIELECIGSWKDGSNQYLVGKIGKHTNDDSYRCYAFEQTSKNPITYKIAESGDGSCSASIYEGAVIITLTETELASKCSFPNWVTSNEWTTLDGQITVHTRKNRNKNEHIRLKSTLFVIDSDSSRSSLDANSYSSTVSHQQPQPQQHNGIHFPVLQGGTRRHPSLERIPLLSGGSRIVCHSKKNISGRHVAILATITQKCQSQKICLHIHKRYDGNILELGVRRMERGDADFDCEASDAIDETGSMHILISKEPTLRQSSRCPNIGRFNMFDEKFVGYENKPIPQCTGTTTTDLGHVGLHSHLETTTTVLVGCKNSAKIYFHSKCVNGEELSTEYVCEGSWEEGEEGYVIMSTTSRSLPTRRICLTYYNPHVHQETLEGQQGSSHGHFISFMASYHTCPRRKLSDDSISTPLTSTIDTIGYTMDKGGLWSFNLSRESEDGQCGGLDTSGSSFRHNRCDSVVVITLVLVLSVMMNKVLF